MNERTAGLLAWQWANYPQAHRNHRNLLVHILSVPIFILGTLGLLLAPLVGFWLALGGLIAMTGAMALQGATHRLEAVSPIPFLGPLDVLARIFAEQWITFPRYLLSGGFASAWRER